MQTTPLLDPQMFNGLENTTHLCVGGEAPWLKRHDDVYARFVNNKTTGFSGREQSLALSESCRDKLGRLWNVPAQRIAFMPSAAEGMAVLSRGLDWQPGDNIVTTNLEFPSVGYAWRNLREQGVEVRMVPHDNWLVREEDLLAAVDKRTRVLAVSQVSFYTGQHLDVEQLAGGLKNHDTLFALDATHASGVMQVPAQLTDLCVSSAYKWMLGTHGVAATYLSERAEALTTQTAFGWRNLEVWKQPSAELEAEVDVAPMPKRLEAGNSATVVILFLNAALELLLEIGADRTQAHARDLSEQVSAGLTRLGRTVISPSERHRRSGNTCFLAEDFVGLREQLEKRNVLVWSDVGRVRVSTHLYNSSQDVELLMDALAEIG